MIPTVFEYGIIIILISLVLAAVYAGIIFFVAQVSFLGIHLTSFLDAFLFTIVLNIIALLLGSLVGTIIAIISEKREIKEPNKILLFILAFAIPFTGWYTTDLLFSSVSIPLWVLSIFSLIMSVFNYGKFNNQFNKKNEETLLTQVENNKNDE